MPTAAVDVPDIPLPFHTHHPFSCLTQHLRSSSWGRAGDDARASSNGVGRALGGQGSAFASCSPLPSPDGPTTEFHPQSRAWPPSGRWGAVRSTSPSLEDRTWGFGGELWAQNLDFHLGEELDHKPIPGKGAGGSCPVKCRLGTGTCLRKVLCLSAPQEGGQVKSGSWSHSHLAPPDLCDL